jgi:hypothetical protein
LLKLAENTVYAMANEGELDSCQPQSERVDLSWNIPASSRLGCCRQSRWRPGCSPAAVYLYIAMLGDERPQLPRQPANPAS